MTFFFNCLRLNHKCAKGSLLGFLISIIFFASHLNIEEESFGFFDSDAETTKTTKMSLSRSERSITNFYREQHLFSSKSDIFIKKMDRMQNNADVFEMQKRLWTEHQKRMNYSVCDTYAQEGNNMSRFYESSIFKDYLHINPDDVTLVTQLTVDRIYLLHLLVEYWSGPISLAIYVEVDQLSTLKREVLSYPSIIDRNNVDVHIVLATGVSLTI